MVIIIINSNGVNSQSNRSASLLNNLANSKNRIAIGIIDVHTHHITMSRDLVVYQVSDRNPLIIFAISCPDFFICLIPFSTHHLHTSTHTHLV